MKNKKFFAALGAVASISTIILSNTLSSALAVAPPSKVIKTAASAAGSSLIASTPIPKTPTVSLPCELGLKDFFTIHVTNSTSKTIRATTKINWKLSNTKSFVFPLDHAVAPGQFFTIVPSATISRVGVTSCSASFKVQ